MKTNHYALMVAAALALAGCSSVKSHVDTGPIHARTFSFINAGSRELPAYAESRKQAHTAVQDAITRNLAEKGVVHAERGGDVTVAYLIIVGNNATTTSLNEYFGYTSDADALTDKFHKTEAVKNNDRAYYEAGTLVIDFLDPGTSKLLKRATVQAQILRELPMAQREARLQGFVDQALADLRFVQ
jgi:PBP1b-binding outer membrane lipoprotein LpoB